MQKNKKRLLPFSCDAIASLFKKKCVVFFVLTCMFVNGFASNVHNAYNCNVIMLLFKVSKNASVQMLNKCGGSMIAVANKICIEIVNAMLPSGSATPAEDRKQKSGGDNAASDYAVIIVAVKSSGKRISADKINEFACLLPFTVFSKLLDGRQRSNFAVGNNKIIILLFLVFIAAVKKRKYFVNALLSCVNISVCKRRVSA